jgi:hypothetical protein
MDNIKTGKYSIIIGCETAPSGKYVVLTAVF